MQGNGGPGRVRDDDAASRVRRGGARSRGRRREDEARHREAHRLGTRQ